MKTTQRMLALVVSGGLTALGLAGGSAAAETRPHARILFSVYSPDNRPSRPGIYSVRPDGSDAVRLTRHPRDFDPEWSPDRTKVAFVRIVKEERASLTFEVPYLYVMDDDGSDKVRIAESAQGHFDWSPDGRNLVFRSANDLWTVRADGTGLQQLTNDPTSDAYPDWSPDGASIAYACEGTICTIPAEGGAEQRLTSRLNDAEDFMPRWSPDSNLIAFVSTRDQYQGEEGPYSTDIFVIGADGSDERRLTDDCHWEDYLAWTPDSERIVYEATDDDDGCPSPGDSEVMAVDTSGSIRNLTSNRSEEYRPDLSPNGRWIVFERPVERTRNRWDVVLRIRSLDGAVRFAVPFEVRGHSVDPSWG